MIAPVSTARTLLDTAVAPLDNRRPRRGRAVRDRARGSLAALLTAVATAVLLSLFAARAAEATVTRYLTGNPADVTPPLFGPAHDLGGGSTDVDAAMQWMID